MAELTPIPSAPRPAEPAYQPLSGYAVAALILAVAFAVILVILVGIGLYYRRTPLSFELLFLPLVGMVLAAVGRSHIRNSEGTRTGTGLATAAMWICALGGAGFAAFLGANYLAMEMESRRKADAFLEALKAGQEHEAFHDHVLPPEMQGRAEPNSPEFEAVYMPAGYPLLAGHRLVHAFRRNGKDVQFEHIGARNVGQEGEGFTATHAYRVKVAEGVFTIQLKLVASESKGGKPKWHIQAGQGLGVGEPNWDFFSPYGRLAMECEQEAGEFARRWMMDLTNGRPGVAHLSLLPRAERETGQAARHVGGYLAGAAVFAVPPAGGADQEFDRLQRSGFFRRDANGNPLPEPKAAELRKLWQSPTLAPASASRRGPMAGASAEMSTFTLGPDAVTVGIQADIVFGPGGMQSAPVTVGVVCSDPALLAALTEAKKKGPVKDDGPVSLRTLPPRDWRIAWFQTTMEQPPMPAPPGADRVGPGGPPGG